MQNTIKVKATFDYKAKTYDLSCVVDIDNLIHHEDIILSIYNILARENNIGMYSYELEVLQDSLLEFLEPTGYVQKCFKDGIFDIASLHIEYKNHHIEQKSKELIKKYNLNDSENIILAIKEACLFEIQK
jgi:hypothetical protein